MPNFLRFLLGVALLPACWGVTAALFDGIVAAAGGSLFCAETLSLLGGVAVFVFCWMGMPRMARTYVFGHEMTHALWGLFFGAVPTRMRVSASGGSVTLSRTNLLITLAPYFFPFYTFVVAAAALVVFAFVRPLPFLPLWMFLVGFTWAFHVLFTLETLTQRQPDVTAYGRVFSWTFIYLANLLLVLAWLASATPLTFAAAGGSLVSRTIGAYASAGAGLLAAARFLLRLFTPNTPS